VRLRCKDYVDALADLDAAIKFNPEQYALHDVKTFPMVQLLGAGGMGCVFLCGNSNPLINKDQVVVKCFWETLKGSPEKVFKEAVAMREIAGEFVPEPLYAGYANPFKQERAFFVTEYVEGTVDGEKWLEKYGTMDLKTGWNVALMLAEGLQVAHDRDIFHLDLKPANILLSDSRAAVPLKIIDFGLAEIAPTLQQEALTRKNQAGLSQFGQAVMGTLHYAPPEQQGETQYGKPSARSDVFAFGATMYRFWTGFIPRRYLDRNLPQVPGLRDLVLDCVEDDPNKRPYSAGEVLGRFKGIEESQRKIKVDEKAWQKARGQDTQSAYEAYLRGKTLKKYAVAAKNRLQAIEASDFAPVVEDDFSVSDESDWIETPVDSNDEVEETKRWLDDRAWVRRVNKIRLLSIKGIWMVIRLRDMQSRLKSGLRRLK
jgi:serine/threonine protein kinase